MRALNSRLVLIDINRSWQASRRLISATATAFSDDNRSGNYVTASDSLPIPLENLEEEPAPLLNIDIASEVMSDDQDEDFLPTTYKKASSKTYPRAKEVLEADLLRVAEVMGLEEDMMMLEKQMSILASSSELKQRIHQSVVLVNNVLVIVTHLQCMLQQQCSVSLCNL
ncbi:hypothetical protein F2Q68_00033003 [Brassica cretica]|uniref:Uncharacterized protein n=1 Tax=Brassica cretica TaxID=69181 RepID=A0A8S9G804_BRACR|nr:hypothetical protein F2Q68_00033003 [Brassica cretica]